MDKSSISEVIRGKEDCTIGWIIPAQIVAKGRLRASDFAVLELVSVIEVESRSVVPVLSGETVEMVIPPPSGESVKSVISEVETVNRQIEVVLR